jgi:hypothetical protein
MNDTFVPLAPVSPSRESNEPFRVKVLPNVNGSAVPFQPLAPSTSALPKAHAHPDHAAKISLKRDGERITSIHVQCGCGETIELNCVY